MPTTSLTLLDRLRRPGHPDAWDRFVRLYAPLLVRWAHLQGFQNADAEDLAQTVLVKLIRLLPGYECRDGRTFRGWLFTICRNEGRDFRLRPATRALPGPDGLATVAALPASADPDEGEYRRHLVRRALELVRHHERAGLVVAVDGTSFAARWNWCARTSPRRRGPRSPGSCWTAARRRRWVASWACRRTRCTWPATGC